MTAELFAFPEAPIARRRSRPKKEPKASSYSAEFEVFWDGYPRKLNCSKFEASKSWEKLTPEQQAQAIAVLPTFTRLCAGKDEQYICHAATWLNQRRWETIVVPNAAPSPVNMARAIEIYRATGRWNDALGPEPK